MNESHETAGGRSMLVIKRALLCITAVLALIGAGKTGSRAYAAQTHGKGYCASPAIRHYERLPQSFPRLRALPTTGKLPFSPRGVEIYPSAVRSPSLRERSPGPRLIVDGGYFSYGFWRPGGGPPLHPEWTVKAGLFSVDSNGNASQRVSSSIRRISSVGGAHHPQITLRVPSTPGFYKVNLSFKNSHNELLAEFNEFIRVMPAIFSVRIGTEKKLYHPGQNLYARVENLGTVEVQYGAPFAIERLTNNEWIRVDPGPHRWPRYLVGLAGGFAGECMQFSIPSYFEPGKYRLSKSMKYDSSDGESAALVRYAAFTIE